MSKYIVDCSDGGDKEVTLTMGDVANHYDTCTTTVFVKDNILPEAMCIADFDTHLDELGQATISPTDIDDRSSDNCMNDLQLQVSPRHFTCDNVGGKTVNLLVTDSSGNSAECTATATVRDNISPRAVCQPYTIQLDDNGAATMDPNDID